MGVVFSALQGSCPRTISDIAVAGAYIGVCRRLFPLLGIECAIAFSNQCQHNCTCVRRCDQPSAYSSWRGPPCNAGESSSSSSSTPVTKASTPFAAPIICIKRPTQQSPRLVIELRPVTLFWRQSVVVDVCLLSFDQQLLCELLISGEGKQRAFGVEASRVRLTTITTITMKTMPHKERSPGDKWSMVA